MAEEGGEMEGLGRQESGRFHKVAAWQSCTCLVDISTLLT